MKLLRSISCCLTLLAGLAAPLRAQTVLLSDLMSGKDIALTLKLKDLTGEWRRVTISPSNDPGSTWMRMVTGAAGASHDVYYTRGQTAAVGSETYLVAYQVHGKPVDMQAMMRGNPDAAPPDPLTAETPIFLALLNQRTMGSLTNIRAFDLQQEITNDAVLHGGAAEDASLSNLKQLGLGIMQYSQDFDETLPPLHDAAVMKKAVMPYIKSEKIFINPVDHKPYATNPLLSKVKMANVAVPSSAVLLFEDAPTAGGTRAVLFMDGHVQRMQEKAWQEMKAKAKIP